MNTFRTTSLLIAIMASVGFTMPNGGSARADEVRREKREELLEQRQSKDILPFEQILKTVMARINGEIIETEFEFEDGMPVYEIKYIDKQGRVRELYVNARSGETIKDKYD